MLIPIMQVAAAESRTFWSYVALITTDTKSARAGQQNIILMFVEVI